MPVDLHVHTTASDGTDTPHDVVVLAKQFGLTAIAITDHDTVAGVEEAYRAGTEYGVEVVPGIEISAEFAGQEVHVLGYFVDIRNQELLTVTKQFQQERIVRIHCMVDAMKRDGLPISFSALQARYPDATLGRAHIAGWLVEQNVCRSVKEAFLQYLKRSSPYYIPRRYLTVPQAARVILRAGGLPVLAHPMLYDYDEPTMRELFTLITREGFAGTEVYYSTYSAEETEATAILAQEFGLVATGGSDYHGNCKPDILLGIGRGGLAVPESVLEALRAKRE